LAAVFQFAQHYEAAEIIPATAPATASAAAWTDIPFASKNKTTNSSVDEIGKRYRLHHAFVVQAACQAVVCGKMCFQATCKLLAYTTRLS